MMRRSIRIFVLTIIALAIFAVPSWAQPFPTATTDDAVEIMPPSQYAAWWFEVENCTGRRGDMRAVKFFLVPTDGRGKFNCRLFGAICLYGLYSPAEHAIYLADTYSGERWLVAHEMLHALGFRSHPSPPYGICAPAKRPKLEDREGTFE